jgi:hypothetical protein
MCVVPCILVMTAVITPTHAQITSLLHILAYMFRPFWVIIRALYTTKDYRIKCVKMNKIPEFLICV